MDNPFNCERCLNLINENNNLKAKVQSQGNFIGSLKQIIIQTEGSLTEGIAKEVSPIKKKLEKETGSSTRQLISALKQCRLLQSQLEELNKRKNSLEASVSDLQGKSDHLAFVNKQLNETYRTHGDEIEKYKSNIQKLKKSLREVEKRKESAPCKACARRDSAKTSDNLPPTPSSLDTRSTWTPPESIGSIPPSPAWIHNYESTEHPNPSPNLVPPAKSPECAPPDSEVGTWNMDRIQDLLGCKGLSIRSPQFRIEVPPCISPLSSAKKVFSGSGIFRHSADPVPTPVTHSSKPVLKSPKLIASDGTESKHWKKSEENRNFYLESTALCRQIDEMHLTQDFVDLKPLPKFGSSKPTFVPPVGPHREVLFGDKVNLYAFGETNRNLWLDTNIVKKETFSDCVKKEEFTLPEFSKCVFTKLRLESKRPDPVWRPILNKEKLKDEAECHDFQSNLEKFNSTTESSVSNKVDELKPTKLNRLIEAKPSIFDSLVSSEVHPSIESSVKRKLETSLVPSKKPTPSLIENIETPQPRLQPSLETVESSEISELGVATRNSRKKPLETPNTNSRIRSLRSSLRKSNEIESNSDMPQATSPPTPEIRQIVTRSWRKRTSNVSPEKDEGEPPKKRISERPLETVEQHPNVPQICATTKSPLKKRSSKTEKITDTNSLADVSLLPTLKDSLEAVEQHPVPITSPERFTKPNLLQPCATSKSLEHPAVERTLAIHPHSVSKSSKSHGTEETADSDSQVCAKVPGVEICPESGENPSSVAVTPPKRPSRLNVLQPSKSPLHERSSKTNEIADTNSLSDVVSPLPKLECSPGTVEQHPVPVTPPKRLKQSNVLQPSKSPLNKRSSKTEKVTDTNSQDLVFPSPVEPSVQVTPPKKLKSRNGVAVSSPSTQSLSPSKKPKSSQSPMKKQQLSPKLKKILPPRRSLPKLFSNARKTIKTQQIANCISETVVDVHDKSLSEEDLVQISAELEAVFAEVILDPSMPLPPFSPESNQRDNVPPDEKMPQSDFKVPQAVKKKKRKITLTQNEINGKSPVCTPPVDIDALKHEKTTAHDDVCVIKSEEVYDIKEVDVTIGNKDCNPNVGIKIEYVDSNQADVESGDESKEPMFIEITASEHQNGVKEEVVSPMELSGIRETEQEDQNRPNCETPDVKKEVVEIENSVDSEGIEVNLLPKCELVNEEDKSVVLTLDPTPETSVEREPSKCTSPVDLLSQIENYFYENNGDEIDEEICSENEESSDDEEPMFIEVTNEPVEEDGSSDCGNRVSNLMQNLEKSYLIETVVEEEDTDGGGKRLNGVAEKQLNHLETFFCRKNEINIETETVEDMRPKSSELPQVDQVEQHQRNDPPSACNAIKFYTSNDSVPDKVVNTVEKPTFLGSVDRLLRKINSEEKWFLTQKKCETQEISFIECNENSLSFAIKYWCDKISQDSVPTQPAYPKLKALSDKEYTRLKMIFSNFERATDFQKGLQSACGSFSSIDPCIFAKFCAKYVIESKSKGTELINDKQKKLIILVLRLYERDDGVSVDFLTVLELLILSTRGEVLKPMQAETVAVFYTVICRVVNQLDRVRTLIIDLVYNRFCCYTIIFKIFSICPDVFPHEKVSQDCLLTYTLANLFSKPPNVSSVAPSMSHVVYSFKRTIEYNYGYADVSTLDRSELFDRLSENLEIPSNRLALILLAKWEGFEWSLKMIETRLYPSMENFMETSSYDDDKLADVVRLFGTMSRGIPLKSLSNAVPQALKYLETILNNTTSHLVMDAAVGALLDFRRNNFLAVASILLKWKPKSGLVTSTTVKYLKAILNHKSLEYWQTFISKNL